MPTALSTVTAQIISPPSKLIPYAPYISNSYGGARWLYHIGVCYPNYWVWTLKLNNMQLHKSRIFAIHHKIVANFSFDLLNLKVQVLQWICSITQFMLKWYFCLSWLGTKGSLSRNLYSYKLVFWTTFTSTVSDGPENSTWVLVKHA